ncbi:Type I transmembrane sorting receptor [Toensbergia leucococca]|nr:Type I transmembrane sorting receptor [Toensbergia leucococca]
MRFITQLGAASALLSIASATPIEKRGVTFTINESVPKSKIRSGPNALAHAYAKFGGTVSPELATAAGTDDGTVTASPEEYDEEYLCPVNIGTPAQTLNLDFDTGSSDLWVFSTELPAADQAGHSVYNPAKSTTSKLLSGETWSISYGDGSSASGNVYDDVVTVGATKVTAQAVEAAKKISSEFVDDVDSDGLLGLAFDSLNTVSPNPQKTFFFNAESSLALPLFTANLKKGAPGSYNFGYIDSSEYTGSITYVPVITSNGFWEFDGDGYAIGSGSFVSTTIDAIADTGTTLLLLPSTVVTAYYKKVSGSSNSATYGGYVFPCSATLPSITLGIGSYRAVVPGSYINYAPVTSGSSTCYGGIQSDAGIGFAIYGDIFLKSQFVVFDATSSPQLGFAAKPT